MSNEETAKAEAVKELLYQLADDDFIHSYRGSEWLGLAPHIEEDVASSSITQDTMGHAAMFYQLLEELGEGDANQLAHERSAGKRRNAIILELENGPGHYMGEPSYDWAFAVVRNYFYTQAKMVKIQSLQASSYQPLADVAVKVRMELHYHLMHWRTWFIQLLSSGHEEALVRMKAAIEKTSNDFKGVFSYGEYREAFVGQGLIEDEEMLIERWHQALAPSLESVGLSRTEISLALGEGRRGIHTKDLDRALETLREVYAIDKAATW
ncbi:1,2-phenylacetyl-CoA epoxidase subunit PaaC [Pradoshia sp.]